MSKTLVEAALSFKPPVEYVTKTYITKRVDYALSLLILLFLETSLQRSCVGFMGQHKSMNQEKTRLPKYRPLLYHGLMSREVAEESLVNMRPGIFLIRSSKTAGKDYVLSMRYDHKNSFNIHINIFKGLQ